MAQVHWSFKKTIMPLTPILVTIQVLSKRCYLEDDINFPGGLSIALKRSLYVLLYRWLLSMNVCPRTLSYMFPSLRVLSQSGMSLIDPLDLYWAFAPFFFRLLQTIQGFYFFIFYIFHLHPFLGHYIQLWVGTHSWALSPHLWGFVFVHGVLPSFMGFCTLFKGSLFWTCNPFKFGVATMSTTKFLYGVNQFERILWLINLVALCGLWRKHLFGPYILALFSFGL